MKYAKKSHSKPKGTKGAGMGWGANGPGGPSKSQAVKKGPMAAGKATGTKA